LGYMYYVYAISSLSRNYIYVGISNNPDRRITQHNKGYNKTTKPYAPFKRILLEAYQTRIRREKEKSF
jgi:putative endonuclease